MADASKLMIVLFSVELVHLEICSWSILRPSIQIKHLFNIYCKSTSKRKEKVYGSCCLKMNYFSHLMGPREVVNCYGKIDSRFAGKAFAARSPLIIEAA